MQRTEDHLIIFLEIYSYMKLISVSLLEICIYPNHILVSFLEIYRYLRLILCHISKYIAIRS